MFIFTKSCSRGLQYEKSHKLSFMSVFVPSLSSQQVVFVLNCGPTGQEV